MPTINNRTNTFALSLRQLFYFFIFTSLLWAVSCSSLKKSSTVNTDTQNNNRSESAIKSTSSVLEARRLLLNGERERAFVKLQLAVKQNPNNDAAYFEMSRITQYANQSSALDNALEYGKKAVSIDRANVWYHRNLIGIYKRQHDYKSAAKEAQLLIKIQPNSKDNYYQLANMYIYAKDYKSALGVYANMETEFGFEEGIILQQKQIFLKLGDYKSALKEVNKLIAYDPNNKKYYGMAADINMAMGDYDLAFANAKKIIAIDPDDGRVHLVLADYYRIKGDNKRAFQEVKIALGTPALEMDTKIKVLLKYFEASTQNAKKKEQAEELMDTVLFANPNSPKAFAMKADYLNQNGDYKDAIIYFRKVIAIDSTRYLVWEQMLLVEERLHNYSAMANESSRALKMFPQQPTLYLFSGKANVKIANYTLAEEHLKMGLNFVFEEKSKSEFYALLAEAEFRLHDFGPAEAHFKRAVKGDPANTEALNYYAYYLAYNNKDIERAKQMSKEAIRRSPNNVDYLYTRAFVLFKSGDNNQANILLDTSLKQFPNNKQLQLLKMEVNKNE